MMPGSRLSKFFFRGFRRYFTFRKWRERRVTPIGNFVLALLLASAIIGLNTKQLVAYQIFGLLLALLCVCWLFAMRVPAALKLRRALPRYATVGVQVCYSVYVSHDGKRKVDGLSLLEIHHDPRPDFAQFQHAEEPGAARRNRYDRMVGYYRWAWLVRRNEVARIDEIHLPPIPPDAVVEQSQRFTPRYRGTLGLSGIALARRDPLGLFRACRVIDLPGSVLVLPRTYRLPPMALPGQRNYQHEHRVKAETRGDGEEIAGLRDYRPGDALRDIHWKSFARTGTPIVKEYQPEFFERHALLLDTIGAPAGDAFEEAVALAASFVGNLDRAECLLDLLFVGTECYCFTMGPGELQAEALMRVLAGVQPCPDQSLQALHATVVSRRGELSGCICILLAWDAARRQMLEEMRQLGLPLLVLLVAELPPADCPLWVHRLRPGQIEQDLGAL